MGVILDTNYRFWNPKTQSIDVGWPLPTAEQPLWMYQRIAQQARSFRQAGFTAIKLPPSCRGGAGQYSDGYDKNDDYNLDGTAFGNTEMLRQCVAAIHAYQMQAYGDLVLHQYGGGHDGSYPSKRFPKTPTCFANTTTKGGVTPDPVPDTSGNFPFGDLAAYAHSLPPGYMHDGAIAAAEWLVDTTDLDGFRIDDTKGTYVPVIRDLLHEEPLLAHVYAVGEYFDGDNAKLSKWVWDDMKGRAGTYDFGFKFNVGGICNNNSRSWMGRLAEIGYVTIDAAHAVTFIESADSDTSPGQQTIWNKILGYAIMLTFPGYPQVYYRDYASDPGCYGLKRWIDNLIWIHENLAQGDFVVRLSDDYQVFVHERMGYGDKPGCVCFFNNDQYNSYTRTVQTHFPPNTRLHEYTGNGGYNNDHWTDGQGRLTVTVPRNDNGFSYLVFAPDVGSRPFRWTPVSTTQSIDGAADLVNTKPAYNGQLLAGRVEIEADAPIEVLLTADTAGWQTNSGVTWDIIGPNGAIALSGRLATAGNPATVSGKAQATGWHEIWLTGNDLPAEGSAFQFEVTYTGANAPQPAPALPLTVPAALTQKRMGAPAPTPAPTPTAAPTASAQVESPNIATTTAQSEHVEAPPARIAPTVS